MAKVAIVTTLKSPGVSVISFVKYHLLRGASKIYLFFDDPNDPDINHVAGMDDVIVIPVDKAQIERQKKVSIAFDLAQWHQTEVMARQVLNAFWALELARQDDMDWIVHIDCDELLYIRDGGIDSFFDDVSEEYLQVAFANYEAAPESLLINDAFREVTLFKKHPGFGSFNEETWRSLTNNSKSSFFIGYDNGKTAARVGKDLLPGIHRFRDSKGGHLPTLYAGDEAILLHYINCGFLQYENKYKILGNFSDQWFGQAPAGPYLHLKSRDAVSSGNPVELQTLYEKEILYSDSDQITKLINTSMLCRIDSIKNLLSMTDATTS